MVRIYDELEQLTPKHNMINRLPLWSIGTTPAFVSDRKKNYAKEDQQEDAYG